MITTPLLEKYRNGDFVQFMNNVLDIVTTDRATALQVAPQRASLLETVERLNTVWQPSVGSELTPQIAALDDQRDKVFTALKLTVDNWALNHYEEDKRNAAYLISDSIAAHGDRIVNMRYQQETATLSAIIHDLENQFAGQVALLELTHWVVKLKELNKNFNDLYVARAQALSTEQIGLVAELRIEVTAVFRKLKELFEARMAIAEVEGATNLVEFQKVRNEWSTLTEQYNDAVTRFKNTDETEETSSTTTTETETPAG